MIRNNLHEIKFGDYVLNYPSVGPEGSVQTSGIVLLAMR